MKHVKDMVLNKPSYELSKEKNEKWKLSKKEIIIKLRLSKKEIIVINNNNNKNKWKEM